jgi:hypothetical protein
MEEKENKEVEVTYKFYLPTHEAEKKIFDRSKEIYLILHEIYNKCRTVWKYEEGASKDRVELAEEVGEMVNRILYDLE